MKAAYLYLIPILLCILLLQSCSSKEDDYISKYCPGSCTVIKGRLTTANGTRPLAHVPLIVKWSSDGGFVSGVSVHKKAVTQTDKDGNYELRFLIRDDELTDGFFAIEPLLDATKYVYCSFDLLDSPFYDLKRDTTLEADYEIPEKAFIELKLNNPGALQSGDSFDASYAYSFGEYGQGLCNKSIRWIHKNNTFKYSNLLEAAADQPLILKLSKLKNGVETKEQIPLQLKPGETKVIAINF